MPAEPGAYGLRPSGIAPTEWLAVEGAGHWPTLEVELDAPETGIDVDRLRARVANGTTLAELIHPVYARLALRVAFSQGHDALHAGALLGASGAWAVVGTKEAGKSSLLAACARAGVEVMCDDALFLDVVYWMCVVL